MEVTDYFRRSVLEDAARSDITVEMCERIVDEAVHAERQENGLWRMWGYVPELDRYIRVIASADRERLINAFKDRNFARERRRERKWGT